jgi:hypothetical protein
MYPDRCGWYDLLFSRYETDSESYETAFEFIYKGLIECGIMQQFKIIGGVFGDGTEFNIRLYDVSNTAVIAELIGVTDDYPEIQDVGSLLNIPEEEAVIEVQVKRTAGTGTVAVGSALVRY